MLCTLEPSHGWMFMAGFALGLILAIIGYNLPQPPDMAPIQTSWHFLSVAVTRVLGD